MHQPLNTYNFVCDINGIDESILVSSTTFPTESLQEMEMFFQGEKVSFPTLPANGGDWAFNVPESDNGHIDAVFDKLKSDMWDQKTGMFNPKKWFDVTVSARDQAKNLVFQVILHGCWMKGKDPVSLDNSATTTPWKWNYHLHYTWIQDVKLHNPGSPCPM